MFLFNDRLYIGSFMNTFYITPSLYVEYGFTSCSLNFSFLFLDIHITLKKKDYVHEIDAEAQKKLDDFLAALDKEESEE